MITTIIKLGYEKDITYKSIFRKDKNTIERCIDCVDRPNTLPYYIHGKGVDGKVLISLSYFDREDRTTDVVKQKWFEPNEKKKAKEYFDFLLIEAITMSKV